MDPWSFTRVSFDELIDVYMEELHYKSQIFIMSMKNQIGCILYLCFISYGELLLYASKYS